MRGWKETKIRKKEKQVEKTERNKERKTIFTNIIFS